MGCWEGIILKKLFIFLTLASIFITLTGCTDGKTPETGLQSGNSNGTNVTTVQDSEQNREEEGTPKEPSMQGQAGKKADSPEVSDKDSSKGSNGEGSPGTKDDLLIMSDNQVSAGSTQSVVNELDREIDKLMQTMNALENIDDKDLEVE